MTELERQGIWCLFVIGHYTGRISYPELLPPFLAEMKQAGIDSDWANLGAEGVASNRVAFAQAVSGGIRAHAEVGVDLSYADDQEGMNEILRALFYLDKITKSGVLAGCTILPSTAYSVSPISSCRRTG